MGQDYSGQRDKSNKATTAPKSSFHSLEYWQINITDLKQLAITYVK